ANRISQIGMEVLAAFECSEPAQRIDRLQAVETEIILDMFPVMGWLERNRPADTANLVKQRLLHVLDTAVVCAGLEIPEYSGGKDPKAGDNASPGAFRTANLVVEAKSFAASVQAWADDIEAADRANLHLQTAELENSIKPFGDSWEFHFGPERG